MCADDVVSSDDRSFYILPCKILSNNKMHEQRIYMFLAEWGTLGTHINTIVLIMSMEFGQMSYYYSSTLSTAIICHTLTWRERERERAFMCIIFPYVLDLADNAKTVWMSENEIKQSKVQHERRNKHKNQQLTTHKPSALLLWLWNNIMEIYSVCCLIEHVLPILISQLDFKQLPWLS